MFVDINDHINVRVYYLKTGHTYKAYTFSEFENLKLRDSEKTKYQMLNVVMKQLTWGLQNNLQDEALRDLPDGTTKFYYKTFKEGKLGQTIVSWDAKDKDGKDVLLSIDTIRGLSPTIAEAIIRGYDEGALLGDEDEKK